MSLLFPSKSGRPRSSFRPAVNALEGRVLLSNWWDPSTWLPKSKITVTPGPKILLSRVDYQPGWRNIAPMDSSEISSSAAFQMCTNVSFESNNTANIEVQAQDNTDSVDFTGTSRVQIWGRSNNQWVKVDDYSETIKTGGHYTLNLLSSHPNPVSYSVPVPSWVTKLASTAPKRIYVSVTYAAADDAPKTSRLPTCRYAPQNSGYVFSVSHSLKSGGSRGSDMRRTPV